jgi:hypothetical protein
MSWNRILLSLKDETCQESIVDIGNRAWDCYRREKEPAGFAMFHATDSLANGGLGDEFIVYLTPVASSVCSEISDKYPFEKCQIPARDEPNMAFVFGDPRMMGNLRESVDTDALVVT